MPSVSLNNVFCIFFPKVLKASHKCGRIDHTIVGDQTGADIERVQEIQKVCDHMYAELKAGRKLNISVLKKKNLNYVEYLDLVF